MLSRISWPQAISRSQGPPLPLCNAQVHLDLARKLHPHTSSGKARILPVLRGSATHLTKVSSSHGGSSGSGTGVGSGTYFRCLHSLLHQRRFNNLVKLYCPPTHLFRKKLFLEKYSVLSDKHFAFGSVVEVIPNSILGITNKVAFVWFRIKLVWL